MFRFLCVFFFFFFFFFFRRQPTESESKAELDRYIDALITIRAEIQEVQDKKIAARDSVLRHAPHTLKVIGSDNWTRKWVPSAAGEAEEQTTKNKQKQKQTSKQQASRPTNKETSKQASKQTSKRTNKQTNIKKRVDVIQF
jgi:hypothetical protein